MKDQNLSGCVAKDDLDPTFFTFVGFKLVERFAVAFGVETQDLPIIHWQQESFEGFGVDVVAWLNLNDC